MAKKKRSAPARRRVGAVKAEGLMPVLTVALGAVLARYLQTKVIPTTVKPALVGAGQLALGVVLSSMKNPMLKGVGLGMAAAGGVSVATSTGLIAGIGRSDILQLRTMPPAREMSLVNGMGNAEGSPEMSLINGIGNPQGSPSMSTILGMESMY